MKAKAMKEKTTTEKRMGKKGPIKAAAKTSAKDMPKKNKNK